jgi:menaquinone-dependent protoporphyrinogen IX oxidase
MKISVVYNSKTGFTKRYAEWIAEELNCGAVLYKNFNQSMANESDLVVFLSRVHAGRIEYLNKIKNLLDGSVSRRLVVAAVGAAPSAAEDTINKYWADNFSGEEIKTIPHFYMQGGLDYEKMGFGDKQMLKFARKFLKNKKDKTDEETDSIQISSSSFDNSAKEFIGPLVECVVNR